MAPPGTKAVIWENPKGRQLWAPRGIDAWYRGPSKDHYRLYKFYCPETQAIRVNGSAKFFPQHCNLPTLSPTQHATTVADKLFEFLATLHKKNRKPILQKTPNSSKTITSEGGSPTAHRNNRTEGGHPSDHQHIHQSNGTTNYGHNNKNTPTHDT